MTDKNQNKQDVKEGGINPVLAAVAGAVVGAGVAVAATVALEDGKTRDKVKEVLVNAKDQTKGYVKDIEEQVQNKIG